MTEKKETDNKKTASPKKATSSRASAKTASTKPAAVKTVSAKTTTAKTAAAKTTTAKAASPKTTAPKTTAPKTTTAKTATARTTRSKVPTNGHTDGAAQEAAIPSVPEVKVLLTASDGHEAPPDALSTQLIEQVDGAPGSPGGNGNGVRKVGVGEVRPVKVRVTNGHFASAAGVNGHGNGSAGNGHNGDAGTLTQQTPEGLASFQKVEMEKWWPIIKSAGIGAQAQ